MRARADIACTADANKRDKNIVLLPRTYLFRHIAQRACCTSYRAAAAFAYICRASAHFRVGTQRIRYCCVAPARVRFHRAVPPRIFANNLALMSTCLWRLRFDAVGGILRACFHLPAASLHRCAVHAVAACLPRTHICLNAPARRAQHITRACCVPRCFAPWNTLFSLRALCAHFCVLHSSARYLVRICYLHCCHLMGVVACRAPGLEHKRVGCLFVGCLFYFVPLPRACVLSFRDTRRAHAYLFCVFASCVRRLLSASRANALILRVFSCVPFVITMTPPYP